VVDFDAHDFVIQAVLEWVVWRFRIEGGEMCWYGFAVTDMVFQAALLVLLICPMC
jgi:hypothetical protein